jgi:hypothetical protein
MAWDMLNRSCGDIVYYLTAREPLGYLRASVSSTKVMWWFGLQLLVTVLGILLLLAQTYYRVVVDTATNDHLIWVRVTPLDTMSSQQPI